MARMRVLWIVNHKGSTTPGEIACILSVSKPTATELVDQCVRAGLLDRRQSAIDRRQVIVTLKPKAHKVITDFAKRRLEKFKRLLSVVHSGDARRLADALETVNDILAKGAP